MKKSSLLFFAASGLCGLLAASSAVASGSYSARPPQPPAKMSDGSKKLDREKYALGQKVYEGGVMTAGAGDAVAQMPRLQALEMKIPADAAKNAHLVALAGKITPEQLDALEHFVEQRFPMKK